MSVYYNENDVYAVAWLRNLIEAGHLPAGDVDDRSIVDVRPGDLKGYVQCHFFAGIGGWPLALRMAGWPDDRPVWTGSCPCQPFSNAGARQGEKDKRHLWPEFLRLIIEWDVPAIFGEQVASGLGRQWLAGVRTDLEDLGYVVGAADLCAASCGAPHIRQRLYWMAHASEQRRSAQSQRSDFTNGRQTQEPGRLRGAGGLADHHQQGRGIVEERDGRSLDGSEVQQRDDINGRDDLRGLGDTDGGLASDGNLQRSWQYGQQPQNDGAVGGLGDDDDARLALGSIEDDGRGAVRLERPPTGATGSLSAWSRYDVVHCTDGKARRFESGSFPLAHGAANRVGRLRAYGNAIVPQVAAQFILATRDIID